MGLTKTSLKQAHQHQTPNSVNLYIYILNTVQQQQQKPLIQKMGKMCLLDALNIKKN